MDPPNGRQGVGQNVRPSGGENVRQSGFGDPNNGGQKAGEIDQQNEVVGRRNDRFKNRTVGLEFEQQYDYDGSQEAGTGNRGRGKGPLNEHPRSFDTNLTNVPTTTDPDKSDTLLPFHFFTTIPPEKIDKSGEQTSGEKESPPYTNVNIQTPRPKGRSTTTPPTLIVEGIVVNSTSSTISPTFGNKNSTKVTPGGDENRGQGTLL